MGWDLAGEVDAGEVEVAEAREPAQERRRRARRRALEVVTAEVEVAQPAEGEERRADRADERRAAGVVPSVVELRAAAACGGGGVVAEAERHHVPVRPVAAPDATPPAAVAASSPTPPRGEAPRGVAGDAVPERQQRVALLRHACQRQGGGGGGGGEQERRGEAARGHGGPRPWTSMDGDGDRFVRLCRRLQSLTRPPPPPWMMDVSLAAIDDGCEGLVVVR